MWTKVMVNQFKMLRGDSILVLVLPGAFPISILEVWSRRKVLKISQNNIIST